MTIDYLPSWNDGGHEAGARRLPRRGSRRAGRRAGRGARQRRHPVVREAELPAARVPARRTGAERSAPTRASPSREEYRALIEGDTVAQSELGLERIAVALIELCAGISPEEFDARVRSFFAQRPAIAIAGCRSPKLRYQPMLELLDELRRAEFDVFIVTGGGTEFVRAISDEFYGVPPERVVGTRASYDFVRDADGRAGLLRNSDLFAADANEGAAKVINIQRELGRRPIFAAGNSPGDAEMLDYAMAADGPDAGAARRPRRRRSRVRLRGRGRHVRHRRLVPRPAARAGLDRGQHAQRLGVRVRRTTRPDARARERGQTATHRAG